MARNNRQSRRPSRRRPRRSARKSVARVIAHVASNGPVPVRVPNDPPRRSLTHERHFTVRVQILYDKDLTEDAGYTYAAHNQTISYRFGKKDKEEYLSVPFTVAQLFAFHARRFGFDTGIAVALRSIKAWGPIPPSPLRLRLHAMPIGGGLGGTAPQTYEDLGTGVNRAKVGFHLPILTWFIASATTSLAYVELQTGDSSPELYAHDQALGVFDVSLVARNYN